MTCLGLQPDQIDKHLNQSGKGFQLDADQMTPSALRFARINQSAERHQSNLKAGLGYLGIWHRIYRIVLVVSIRMNSV